jgi:hypothetical protein
MGSLLTGTVFSDFVFGGWQGDWTFGSGFTPDTLTLVTRQTGEDPGPSAVALQTWRQIPDASPPAGQTQVYDFDPGAAVADRFLFVPTGTGIVAPNVAEVLSPNWAPYADSPNPILPWNVTAYLMPDNGGTDDITANGRPGLLKTLNYRFVDPGIGGGATNYWLKKYKLMRYGHFDPTDTGSPIVVKAALDAKINAVMYAQEGCFFVIPGDYFDEDVNDATAPFYRRYNYKLEIHGAIAENFHAGPEAWGVWQDRWAYPQYYLRVSGLPALAWATISYHYDPTLLANRTQAQTTYNGTDRRSTATVPDAGINLPKLPALPTCQGLVFEGSGP